MAGHASRDRVDRELDRDAALDEQLAQLPDLVLRLGDRHAVAGNHDHLLGKGHHDPDIGRFDRLQAALHRARTRHGAARVPESGEQHVAQRPIHGPRHQLREQSAGRAHDRAGDDHRSVVEHEAFESHRQSGERVVKRDHDRHVRAADR